MSRKNTFPLLSVRSRNGDLHPGPLLLGEDFGFRTLDRRVVRRRWLTPVDDLDGMVSWSSGARRRSVAKLRKTSVGFQCQPSSYVRLESYGFFGWCEGA